MAKAQTSPPSNITFRAHLLGSVNDFCDAAALGALGRPAVVVELVVALARYVEEGRKLHPDVYLLGSLHNTLKLLPGSTVQVVGTAPASGDFVRQSLKKCAPLASGGWRVFLELNEDKVTYGLFHGDLNPIAVPIDEALFSAADPSLSVVRVHQLADDCVEIRNSRGHRHNIYLSNKRETDPSPNRFLEALVDSICSEVAPALKESVQTYLGRTLEESLRESHGCLVAVARRTKPPAFLRDGIRLDPPISISEQVQHALRDSRAEAELRATSALIGGMFRSDGIVLFSNRGLLLGYNCFVKQPANAKGPAVGGARRRAYEALCARVGRGLVAAYVQSQDGWSDFRD